MDFRTRNIPRDKERHYIINMKGSVHPEDMGIINIYIPNNQFLKYMKHKLTDERRKLND